MTTTTVELVRPDDTEGSSPVGLWGMWVLIATEAMIFAALLSSWFFVRSSSQVWPQGGIEVPPLSRIIFFSIVLVASSIPLFIGEAAIKRGHVRRLRAMLFVSWVMGVAFIVNQGFEFAELPFGVRDNAYASLFIVITGLHGLHVLAGLGMSVVVQIKAKLGWFDADHHVTVSVFSLYWHFVDGVWLFVFGSLYLAARIR
jgi:heme/copper-type cytochrome/quinol oxidase subunit 3